MNWKWKVDKCEFKELMSSIKCGKETVECIKGWSDSSGKILKILCREHEELIHNVKNK